MPEINTETAKEYARDAKEYAKESTKDLMEKLEHIGKSPATEQILVGGAAGLIAGFVCAKFGRNAAIAICAAVLLLQIAVHRRNVSVDWKNLEGTSQAVREKLEKLMHGEPRSALVSAKHFVRNNAFFLISFSAGFVVGLGAG